MPQPRDRRHLFLGKAERKDYRPHRPPQIPPPPAPASRAAHGRALGALLETAVREAVQMRHDVGLEIEGAKPGLYLQLASTQQSELNLPGLETRGVEVVAVNQAIPEAEGSTAPRQTATLFLPDKAVDGFSKRLQTYANDEPKQPREPRHEAAFDPVAGLGRADPKALWTDNPSYFPADNKTIWMEVWLRRTDGHEVRRFKEFADHQGILLGGRRLSFDDRTVLLAHTSPNQLAASMVVMGDLAELRRAQETAAFFARLPAVDQAAWGRDLIERTVPAPPNAPAICVLDTGIHRHHPLLEPSLAAEDCHACDPAWGSFDTDGHGTEMAGLALYADLLHPGTSKNCNFGSLYKRQ